MSIPNILHQIRVRYSVAIYISVFALTGFGIIMIYSASAIYAERNMHNEYYFFVRQIFNFVVGTIMFFTATRIPYKNYNKFIAPLMIITFILMIIVLIPGVGKQVGQARRWIRLFGFGFQPAELLKLTLIIWVAGFLDRKKDELNYFTRGLLPSLLVMGTFLFLLILQPDFGTSVLIATTLLLMIFVAGLKKRHMILSLVGLGSLGLFLIISQPYRMRRILGFLHAWDDPLDKGYQLIQSLIAIGTGGIFGKGLGNSTQKLFFLPEAHTDFIYSIIAEETGFIGSMILLFFLIVLLLAGIEVALNAHEDFGRNMAFGITILITIQSLLNICVSTGLIPTKGIPLPFISYGGSSLIMNMFMIGILVNISRYYYQKKQ